LSTQRPDAAVVPPPRLRSSAQRFRLGFAGATALGVVLEGVFETSMAMTRWLAG
jgi:hypothetical protein